MSFTGYNEINSHKAVEKWLFLVLSIVCSGCTESQLYNLLFWQLYLACNSLKAILTSRNYYYFFMNGIDGLVFISKLKSYLQVENVFISKLKTEFTSPIMKSSSPGLLPGHYSLCTLFNIFSWNLNLWMPFNNTFTLKYETNLPEEMNEIPFVSFLPKQYRNNYSCIACNYLFCVLNCLK